MASGKQPLKQIKLDGKTVSISAANFKVLGNIGRAGGAANDALQCCGSPFNAVFPTCSHEKARGDFMVNKTLINQIKNNM